MIFLSVPAAGKKARAQNPNVVYEALIAEMAAEDTQALEKLYEQTKTMVYGFALSLTKNAQDAEDVTQDTYVRLFQAAKSYRPQGKPMAWILTITRNLFLMKLRKKKNQGAPFQDYLVSPEK
jgi:RNA polymerase sigma factor (sigma-70 family)